MTRVPFFAGARTWAEHGARHLELIGAALADGRALQAPAVAAFETALADACGREHAVAVGSGTDALALALLAAGVGPGAEVLVPAVSFVASASCVLRVGAVPVFVDVDGHGLLDLDDAARALSPRTRALVAVDLYGQPVDGDAFEVFAAAHDLVLVEDVAQALGAHWRDRPAGSIGAVACCSFDPTKNVSAPGSGGAALCDDPELAARLRRLRWHGRDADGLHAELGYNSQLSTACAVVLHDKLALTAGWTERRRAIAAAYDDALAETEARPLGVAPDRTHVFHKYVLRSPDRDGLQARLDAAGIDTLVHYALPLTRQPLFAAGPGVRPCPAAERLCSAALSLPIHAYLDDDEVARVCAALAA